ncbi:MAG TPA: hypothetical protein VF746_23820 [Longimicrobium sp.]|jgi:hypothetical protein
MPNRISLPRRRGVRALALAAFALLAACGRPAAQARPERPKPAGAVSAMDLGGQKVLILPVQSVRGLPVTRDQATAEIVFALGEWDARTPWVTPEQLRAALRRAPGYAPDPGTLPRDAFVHHQERYVVEPLIGQLRRYTALMDTRLVLVLREAAWLPVPDGSGGVVRLSAAMIDSRNGNIVWLGEADGPARPQADAAGVATAAAALAARMVVPGQQ